MTQAGRPFDGAVSAASAAQFHRDGFLLVDSVLGPAETRRVAGRFDELFEGRFSTGVYPDEWHWREGISKPDAFREIVNAWKSDGVVAEVARSEALGRLAARLMGWTAGARLAQDDVLWKPPLAGAVAFHQDAAYISAQFTPMANNSVTIWIALDDADQETGVVEYAPGSHRWPAAAAAAAVSTFHGAGADGGAADYRRAMLEAAPAGCADPAGSIERLVVRAGSAVVHHQDTWHGSAPNSSPWRHRRALGVHLVRADVRWRESPPPDYIYGRYVLPGEPRPRDVFFPIVFDGRDSEKSKL